ncbi:MAG: PQQ-dependent sugar dehydrogenase [Planctomycetota bacterium]
MNKSRVLSACVAFLVGAALARAQSLPVGFQVDAGLATGFTQPTDFCFLDDGRILVCEKISGQILLHVPGLAGPPVVVAAFAALETFGERGLHSLAPDPDFAANGRLYVVATRNAPGGNFVRLSRITLAGDLSDGTSANLAFVTGSEMTLVEVPDLDQLHNGGTVRFGPDGHLYVTMGDDADPCGSRILANGRGSIWRLDVSSIGSLPPTGPQDLVPVDNPQAGAAAPLEGLAIAFGFRNPFSMCIDPATGDLFLGDVGSSSREEVDHWEYPTSGPFVLRDYGWPWREGDIPGGGCPGSPPGGFTEPIDVRVYGPEGQVVIVGEIYRPLGAPLDLGPDYHGCLLHGDFGTGTLIWLERDAVTGAWSRKAPVAGQPGPNIWGAGFAGILRYRRGPDGAIWFLDHVSGSIGRIRSAAVQSSLAVVGGQGQVGMKTRAFLLPCEFELVDGAGAPLAGIPIEFEASPNGLLGNPGPALTDAAGRVSTAVLATGSGEVRVTARRADAPTIAATATAFARGLDMQLVPAAGLDIVVCDFVNTSNGNAPVPFLFALSAPGFQPFPSPYGMFHFDPYNLVDTYIIEDPLGVLGNGQTQGGWGNPSRTNVYVVPAGLLNGAMAFQCIWLDGTTPSSIAGLSPSYLALSPPEYLPLP